MRRGTCVGVVVLVCLGVAPGVAFGEGLLGVSGSGSSVFGSELVAPEAALGGQGASEVAEVERANPEAVVAREESQTKYGGLDSKEAGKLAAEVFPGVVGHVAGGVPALPDGEWVSGYSGASVAQLVLEDGKHGALESSVPIATESAPGQWTPVDLAVSEGAGGFRPARSAVGVGIPKRLQDGVSLEGSGVSLTPINGSGVAVGGAEGVVDGAVVFYGGVSVGSDVDELVKPLPSGFAEDAVLRSAASPERLSYRVGVPAGGSLVPVSGESGAVEVVVGGSVVAVVSAPSAFDSMGSAVPVSSSVSGDALTLTVKREPNEFEYPIEVDPTVVDKSFADWGFETQGFFGNKEGGILEDSSSIAQTGSWGIWAYPTKGESHIFDFISETQSSGEHVENELGLVSPHGAEKSVLYGSSYANTRTELCSEAGCAPGKVTAESKENAAYFEQVGHGEGGKSFLAKMTSAAVEILQEKGPTAEFNFSNPRVGSDIESEPVNVLYANTWLGASDAAFEGRSTDPGMGVKEVSMLVPSNPTYDLTIHSACVAVECEKTMNWSFGYPPQLPEGEDKVEFRAVDEAGLSATAAATTVKVDYSPPHSITLSGLPPNNEIGSGLYHLKASATDGSGSTTSSGVASLVLKIDGKQIGGALGSCSPGPCSASGEWTISGTEFAVGQHEVTVTATDKAGNVATEKFTMFVARPTTPISLGPGTVNPQSGEFSLGATDVSLDAPGGALTVSRDYGSLHVTAGSEGPLGPQWTLSLDGSQNLTKLPDGDMLLTDGPGLQAVYASKGSGEFTAPKGDEGLVLSEKKTGETIEFQLKDTGGSVTTFTPAGVAGVSEWVPTVREEANGLNVTKITYRVAGTITEPTKLVAPAPSGVSCSTELVKGCRALEFIYATKTTATGESTSEWGDYEGRLKEVTFTAWEPVAGKMATKTVADYQYDKRGRLRAVWNPLISPVLKTTYGYDAAGHVTALTPAGQQPWLITYGTLAGDSRSGRLLSVTRPSASTAAGDGIAPSDTTAPAISGTLAVGSTLSVSTGTWSNGPLAYDYQWERCNTTGTECSPITGATNASYVVGSGNSVHKLRVQVSATNMSATASALTAATTEVSKPSRFYFQFGWPGSGAGEFSNPAGEAVDSKGNLWVVDTAGDRIEEFEASGVYLASYGKEGSKEVQFKTPTGIAINPANGNLYITDSGNNRVEELTSGGKYVTAFGTEGEGNGQFKDPTGIAILGEAIYVVDTGNDRIQAFKLSTNEFSWKLGSKSSGKEQLLEPQGIALYEGSYGTCAYVTDTGNDRVRRIFINPSNHLFEDAVGSKGSGEGQFLSPIGITIAEGSMYVVDSGNDRIERFDSSTSCEFAEEREVEEMRYRSQFGSAGAGIFGELLNPKWITSQTTGAYNGSLYIGDSENKRIVQTSTSALAEPPAEPPTPPALGSNAVWTVEYKVPLYGNGAPYTMSSSEVAKWAQSDIPTEATAVFPPDEPMGWPAKDYKRATIYYLDSKGRTVNLASPGGGIATTEYNTTNDITRTLTPDNRQAALKEGTKSAEKSKLLDTESTYNSEGTELKSTLGPQHTIRLASGSQIEARSHTLYSYDEGAPTEGGPYQLVTKVTNGALYTGKEEEVRTTTTSYSGQENLGWKLGKPTSITSDPGGLNITHTMLYEASTGNVTETRMPASTEAKSPHDEQTIYYTAPANSEYPGCGGHPEWAGLACRTQPGAQPKDTSLPPLPVTTDTYNIWDEPEKTVSSSGTSNRKTTTTYDSAGRSLTSETTATTDTALPKTTNEYSTENGALIKQSTTTEGKTKTVTSVVNSLGQLTSYTDSDGNTATYKYDIDGRAEEAGDGKGTQKYSYDKTTGELTELTDSAATGFHLTAAYDVEGNMTSESYPNGMTANYTYNQTREATGLEYKKTTHCSEKCVWYNETIAPSIHGQNLYQTNTVAGETTTNKYTYDTAGRLTAVEETPPGTEPECKHRGYTYEEDSNRTSYTLYKDNESDQCVSSEGSTSEHHSYDEADRLTDTGVTYEAFGNITALPATDAGGHELTSTYYVDSQLATQTQNGESIAYNLDPAGRTRETVATGKTSQDTINHYPGPDASPAWTTEPISGSWTRNIQGIGSGLIATQTNGETPILQLTDLHGDIIATAALSETETKLLTTPTMTEYGVPTTSTPAKYSWLGASQLPTELPTGVIAMGARSYIPQLGRYLQPDPIPGGSANAYTYVFDDPNDETDPSGTSGLPLWLIQFAATNAQQISEEATTHEAAAREEAAQRAMAAIEAANKAAADQIPASEDGGGWTLEDGEMAEVQSEMEEDGSYTANAACSFTCFVGGIVNKAKEGFHIVFEHSIFSPGHQVADSRGMTFDDFMGDLYEPGLGCYKQGKDDGDEVMAATPPPYDEAFYTPAVVLGCIQGALGG